MNNIEQIRMFVKTVQLGSFSACARQLGKVQSAISQGIANLEIDMDVQLFNRTTRKPSLTSEGERLLPYAEAILHQVNEFQTIVDSINKGEEPLIRLAMDNALMVPKLTELLSDFNRRFPTTSIEINTTPSTDVINQIHQGKADIGLMFADLSFKQTVDLCFIGNLPFYAVCGKNHPLAGRSALKVGDLIPHKQISIRGENNEDNVLSPAMSASLWWANDFLNIRGLVMQDIGWSYLPIHLVEKELKDGSLCQLDLAFDHKAWSPPIDLVTEKNRSQGDALQWLFDSLKCLLDD